MKAKTRLLKESQSDSEKTNIEADYSWIQYAPSSE